MRKFPPFIIFIAAFGLFGWAGYDYAESGEETGVINIADETGSSDAITLNPSMSPIRMSLKVVYGIDLLEANNQAFEYDIILRGPDGVALFDVTGAQRDKREDNTPEFDTKSSLVVLATLDIPMAGSYIFDWKISPQKAKITAQSILLRRNVRPVQWPLVFLGAVSLILAIVSLRYRRRKTNINRVKGK